MPIYEFRCSECGFVFEVLRPMGDDGSELDCPGCGASALEKLVSSFAAATGGKGQVGASASRCVGGGFT